MIVHSPRMIAGLAMLSLGFFDGILGVAWLSIHDDLGVSLESLGWVLGAVGVGSAFGSAMFPTVVRNLSHLNVLALSLGVQAIVCMLVILNNQYWLLVILYAARGFFNGLAHASLNAYFAQRISPQHLMNIHGGWGVGTALAGFLCGVLITTDWGWEPVYLIGGTLSFSAMGVIFWTRHHFGHLDVMPSESLSGAFRVSVPVFFAIASGALYVGLEQGVGNWISSLLVSIDGAQIHQAGLATGFFWTGLTVGRLTLTRIPVASNQMLKWASGSIVVVLLLLLWIPSEFKIVMYAGLGIAMAPMSAFILVAGARLVPSARRDLMMALQVLAFSVGAAVIPSTLGGIASVASMTILPWVFLAVATLLIVSIWITVRDQEKESWMLIALTQLLFCQLMGEVIARAFDLAIPGPVIGMSLLLVALLYRQSIPEHLETTAEGILSHLSLLFVPAGVGVVAHLTVLGNEWQAIIGSLIGSTVITVLVTGWVLQRLHRGASHES